MKNKLTDLNDHLFAQIERLGDEELTKDNLDEEINRTKAITSVANQIISNARVALDAEQLKQEYAMGSGFSTPKMIGSDK